MTAETTTKATTGRHTQKLPPSPAMRDEWAMAAEMNRTHPKPGAEWVPRDTIYSDPALTPRRGGVDWDTVRRYADVFRDLPAITVQAETFRLIDGRHRWTASYETAANTVLIPITEVVCSDDEAIDLSVRANVAHGLPFAQADRLYWAKDFLKRHPDWSDSRIAEWTGASERYIWGERAKLVRSGLEQPKTRTGRDGKTRDMTNAKTPPRNQPPHRAEVVTTFEPDPEPEMGDEYAESESPLRPGHDLIAAASAIRQRLYEYGTMVEDGEMAEALNRILDLADEVNALANATRKALG